MKQPIGVCPAIVVDNADPENIGRVKVRFPQGPVATESGYEAWARLATLMAGANRGTWFVPEVRDEVLVAFEAGDLARPYVIGALWSGTSQPPEKMDAGNTRKVLRTRSGVKLTIDDEGGQESVTIETPAGQKLLLRDGSGAVEISDGNGNAVQLRANGISVNATSKITVHASAVELNASMLSVNAAMSRFSGVVQCDSLISNSVVSQSYTPGAGNLF